MSFFDGLRHRLYVIVRGERYAHETQHELRFHRDLEQLAATSSGSDAVEGELVARRMLGNDTYYREEVRRMTPLAWADRIRQDLSYAWRGLVRAPAFTITVVVTLALGLGVNAAMYSFLDQVFFRPPAGVHDPATVRRLYGRFTSRETFVTAGLDYRQYQAIGDALGSQASVAAYIQSDSSLMIDGARGIPARRSHVTSSYFSVLGLRPVIGRFFTADEGKIDGRSEIAVIGYGLWRDAFGAGNDVLGTIVTIKDRRFTIVGVAPEHFSGIDLNRTDFWVPMNTYAGRSDLGKPWYLSFPNSLRVIARTNDVITDAQLKAIGTVGYRRGRMLDSPTPDSTIALLTGPLAAARGPAPQQREITTSTRLAGVALVVLLIACANVANLLVVRATQRGREIAVRRALGVSNGRLFEQFMTESMVLVTIAGGSALWVALWVATILRRLLLPTIQWASGVLDWRVVGFTAAAAVVVGLLAGLAPVAHAMKPDLIGSLRAGWREAGYRRSALRNGLLVVQAALSIVLVVGAGVFVRSLRNVEAIDVGYDASQLIMAEPVFEDEFQADAPSTTKVVAAVAAELASRGDITHVAVAEVAPMRGWMSHSLFLPGRDSFPRLPGSAGRGAGNAVSPEYFATTGLRLLAGRTFEKSDRSIKDSIVPTALIVNATMARTLWPGEPAIGKCIVFSKRINPCTPVVGVVDDSRRSSRIEGASMQYYLPLRERGGGALLVRGRSPALIEEVRRLMANRIAGELFINVRPLSSDLERELRPWRLGAHLFTAMGLLALIVSAIGIYSVVSYAVSQRTNEMGIRIALGARVFDILNLVMTETLRVVAAGVAIGVLVALALGRFVASLLYGVSPHDVSVLITSIVVLCTLGLFASAIPGWRAARADPVIALRAD